MLRMGHSYYWTQGLVLLDFTGFTGYSFFCVSLTVSESSEDVLCL
jgi:hypothetical protein